MCGDLLQEAKYLGVTISNYLKWEKHVNAKTNQANSTLRFISTTFLHYPKNAHQPV